MKRATIPPIPPSPMFASTKKLNAIAASPMRQIVTGSRLFIMLVWTWTSGSSSKGFGLECKSWYAGIRDETVSIPTFGPIVRGANPSTSPGKRMKTKGTILQKNNKFIAIIIKLNTKILPVSSLICPEITYYRVDSY